MRNERGAPLAEGATLTRNDSTGQRKRGRMAGQGRVDRRHLSVVTDALADLAGVAAGGCDVVIDSPHLACLCPDMLCKHVVRAGQAQAAIHALVCSCGGAR